MRHHRKNNITRALPLFLTLVAAPAAWAQTDDSLRSLNLEDISIKARRSSGVTRLSGAENGTEISQEELFRAACCNLGESFVANPSVDVNYNDAAVGARQIKLLGLSGQYVQMMTENIPVPTGASLPYALGYVPGAWMKSIMVSKGTSSVKYGYQSITGQINVDYLKPDDDQGLVFNLYGNSMLKTEANLVGNIHLNKHLSTELLAHYEHDFAHHDDDHDNWHDLPSISQLHLQNRWKYTKGRYIFHGGLGLIDEDREGGQLTSVSNPYRVLLGARRYEAYMKHAYLLNREHNTNLAFILSADRHALDGTFGLRTYANTQRSLYSQLVLEHDFSALHSLSAGLGLTADRVEESLSLLPNAIDTRETTAGAYAQYTFKPTYRFTAMAGLRVDHSNLFGTFATPRLHLKWMPTDLLTLRGSVGKGYRHAYAYAENHYLLASGRTLVVADDLPLEEAWNTGLSASLLVPVGERNVRVGLEYYYTDFLHQAVVDMDSDPTRFLVADLDGRSYSHTVQLDLNYAFSEQLEATAAFRYNDVRCTYGGRLMEKPLTSRYKGLLTVAWKPMMGLWQVDATLQFCGGGRLPGGGTFNAYPQLNLQVTRWFRRISVYVGGENLTGYRQSDPIIGAENPWSPTFEPTFIYGPVHGAVAYAGLRLNIGKM